MYTGKCPQCHETVIVHENPGNVAFEMEGKVVTNCVNCGHELRYAEVVPEMAKTESRYLAE